MLSLSKELMGALGLGIVWVNTLLIVAAAGIELRRLAKRRRQLAPLAPGARGVGVVQATVADGIVAYHRVEQIGRAEDAGGREQAGILFADRSYGGVALGGSMRLADGGSVMVAPSDRAEVWVDDERVRAAAACPSNERFDEAYEDARKARGFARELRIDVARGDRLWLYGALRDGGASGAIMEPAPEGLLVATMDPRAFCRSKMAILAAFMAGTLGVAAGATALALSPPLFGTASKIGAALCLAYFLLVQPVGTAVRDAVRTPDRRIVRGRWQRTAVRSPATALRRAES